MHTIIYGALHMYYLYLFAYAYALRINNSMHTYNMLYQYTDKFSNQVFISNKNPTFGNKLHLAVYTSTKPTMTSSLSLREVIKPRFGVSIIKHPN